MEDLHSIILNVVSSFICPTLTALWLFFAHRYRSYLAQRKPAPPHEHTWVGELLWLVRLLFSVMGLELVCTVIAYYWMYDTAWWRQGIGFVLSIAAVMLMLVAVSDDRTFANGDHPRRRLVRIVSLSIRFIAFIWFYGAFINLVYVNAASKQLRNWVATNGGDLSRAIQHAALVATAHPSK